MGSNFGGDDKLVMVSPLDIAAAAAEELTDTAPQSKVRYIASDEYACNEIAKLIGEAIGRPNLQWQTFTDGQVRDSMLAQGRPEVISNLLVELGAALHSGLLRRDYDKHKPALGKTKLPEFIKEFAAAYRDHNN